MSEFWKRKMRTHFKTWDYDGDGYISEKDFADMGRRYAEAYNANDERKEDLIQSFVKVWRMLSKVRDIEKGDRMTVPILIESVKQQLYDPALTSEYNHMIRVLHGLMDVKQDGYLQPKEYKTLIRNLGVAKGTFDEKAAFEAIDVNGDGKISIDELIESFLDFMFSQDENSPHKFIFGPLAD